MIRYEVKSVRSRKQVSNNYSVFYCSMFFLLLATFIMGLVMAAFGAVTDILLASRHQLTLNCSQVA